MAGLWLSLLTISPCGKHYRINTPSPPPPHGDFPCTLPWNHFMRSINFIKEKAKPGKRPLTRKNKASNKENTNGCQFCLKSEREEIKDFPARARSQKCLQVWHSEVIPVLSCLFIYICCTSERETQDFICRQQLWSRVDIALIRVRIL